MSKGEKVKERFSPSFQLSRSLHNGGRWVGGRIGERGRGREEAHPPMGLVCRSQSPSSSEEFRDFGTRLRNAKEKIRSALKNEEGSAGRMHREEKNGR